MNKLAIFLLVLASPLIARDRVSGWCQQGGKTGITTSTRLTVAPRLQASYPNCLVTVWVTGTTNLAAIYGDNSGTVKSNPFVADQNAYWFFYADNGRYDMRFSGAGISTPFTVSDVRANDIAGGTSGGGTVGNGMIGDGIADDTAAFQAFLIANAGGETSIRPGTYRLVGSITMPSNTRLTCSSAYSTTFKRDQPNNAINTFSITNPNVSIMNCGFDGNKAAGNAGTIFYVSGAHFTFNHNTVKNSGSFAIYMPSGANFAKISGNSFTSNNRSAVRISGSNSGTIITGNDIDSTNIPNDGENQALKLHAEGGNTTLSDLVVANNNIKVGGTGDGSAMCIEVFRPGGSTTDIAQRANISHNNCVLNIKGFTGISMAGTIDSIVDGNTIVAGTSSTGLIENAACARMTVSNNNIYGGAGLSITQTSDSNYTGNRMTIGFRQGILIYTDTGSGNAPLGGNNLVTGNTVHFIAGHSPLAYGVRIDCNAVAGICNSNQVVANQFVANDTYGSTIGVEITGNGGTTNNTLIASNKFDTFGIGVKIPSGRAANTHVFHNQYVAVPTITQTNGNSTVVIEEPGTGTIYTDTIQNSSLLKSDVGARAGLQFVGPQEGASFQIGRSFDSLQVGSCQGSTNANCITHNAISWGAPNQGGIISTNSLYTGNGNWGQSTDSAYTRALFLHEGASAFTVGFGPAASANTQAMPEDNTPFQVTESGVNFGTAGRQNGSFLTNMVSVSASWSPPTIPANGNVEQTFGLGCAAGDQAMAGFTGTPGFFVTVEAAASPGFINVYITNKTGSPVTLPSGTMHGACYRTT